MNLFETSDTNLIIPGTTVWENGFAKIPFPRDIFNGPFDGRYVVENGEFGPCYIGMARKLLDEMKTSAFRG